MFSEHATKSMKDFAFSLINSVDVVVDEDSIFLGVWINSLIHLLFVCKMR